MKRSNIIRDNADIPAKAKFRGIGISYCCRSLKIPACAGMTTLTVIPAQAAVRRIGISQCRRNFKLRITCDRPRLSLPLAPLLLVALALTLASGNVLAFDLRGHAKLQTNVTNLPSDSLLQDFSDDPMSDNGVDIRLNYSDRAAGWNWRADYQLLARQGLSLIHI